MQLKSIGPLESIDQLESLDQRIRVEHRSWHGHYVEALRRVNAADKTTFQSAEFQRWLWTQTDNAIGIGQGTSVTIDPAAFTDRALLDDLWNVRQNRPTDGQHRQPAELTETFHAIMKRMVPRYARRRPQARLIRVLALLRPREVTCMVWYERLRRTLNRLEFTRLPRGAINRHTTILVELDRHLGTAEDIETQAWRSILGWQLSTEEPFGKPAPGESDDKLLVRPASAQRKGLSGLPGGKDLLLDLLRRVEPGLDRAELADELRRVEAYSHWSNATIQTRISLLKTLGLVEKRQGELHCTSRGLELLNGAQISEILAPFLISQVLGIAFLLDQLRAGRRSKADLVGSIQQLHAGWTTKYAPAVVVSWAHTANLITAPEPGLVELTDAGHKWVARLPSNIEILAHAQTTDEVIDTFEPPEVDELPLQALEEAPPALRQVPLAELEAHFNAAGGADLILQAGMLRMTHAALHAAANKRFLVLGGLSGTGKTSFARTYATAMCAALGATPAKHHQCFVAVRPDWTDPTGLLGFSSFIAQHPKWHRTPALALLLRATKAPEAPHFLILEEMNLARVEHYLAPLLTAMENPGSNLRIHGEQEHIDGVPPTIAWPRNLFIIGTVNMDATTHALSDKVLDRAFIWETDQIRIDEWRKRKAIDSPSAHLEPVAELLQVLYKPLETCDRHFGYRVCDEVLGFCEAADAHSSDVLDAAVFSKILPRIRGVETKELTATLTDLIQICATRTLERSQRKLTRMHSALQAGMVRFWS